MKVQAHEREPKGAPKELEGVLKHWVEVFAMPATLPPPQVQDHAIILKEGTSSINVQPYRYPQTQKDEIKKLVREMLAVDPTKCKSFFEPILLVKKKRW